MMTAETNGTEMLIQAAVFVAIFLSLLGFFDWRKNKKIQWRRNCLITFGFSVIGMGAELIKSKAGLEWMFWLMLLQIFLGIGWLVFLYKIVLPPKTGTD